MECLEGALVLCQPGRSEFFSRALPYLPLGSGFSLIESPPWSRRVLWGRGGVSTVTEDQVSFLIQGPVVQLGREKTTQKLIIDLKTLYPRSTVVFSTWRTPGPTTNTAADKVVISCDPGSQVDPESGHYWNGIRQIVGADAGLKVITTTHTIKLRSDLRVVRSGLIKALNCRPAQFESDFKVTKETLMVLDFTSIDPFKNYPLLFHPCDWIYGGLTEDLLTVFAVKDLPVSEVQHQDHLQSRCWEITPEHSEARYRPESQIWIPFIARRGFQIPRNSSEQSPKLARLSDELFTHNLMVVSLSQLGLRSDKYPQSLFQRGSWHRLFRYKYSYTYYEWILAHRKKSPLRVPLMFSLEGLLMLTLKNIERLLSTFAGPHQKSPLH